MKKFIREYRVEIIAVLFVLVGAFLLFERLSIRQTLLGATIYITNLLKEALFWMVDSLAIYLSNITLSDLLGWMLISLAVVFITWRARYRYLKSATWRSTNCPRCGSPLRRMHRSRFDHLLGKWVLPQARRYHCTNQTCGWSGLRQRIDREQFPREPLASADG